MDDNLCRAVKITFVPTTVQAPMRHASLKTATTVYLACMVSMQIGILWELRKPISTGFGDFAAFYTASKMVRDGNGRQLYDLHKQWIVQRSFAPGVAIRQGPLPFIRPPFQSLLLLPLAYLPYPWAAAAWLLASVLLLIAIPFVAPRSQPVARFWPGALEGVFCLGLFPVGNALLNGQDSIVLLFLLFCAISSLLRGSDYWAGALLALCLFKFHLIWLIVVFLLLKRKYRVLGPFGVVAIFLLLLSTMLVGWHDLIEYPQYVLKLDQTAGAGLTTLEAMPTLRPLVTALFGTSIPAGVALAIAGVVGVFLVWKSEGTKQVGGIDISLLIVVTLLTAYHAYSYDLTLLLIPIFFVGVDGRGLGPDPLARIAYLTSVGLFSFSSLHWWMVLSTKSYWILGLVILVLMGYALVRANPGISPPLAAEG